MSLNKIFESTNKEEAAEAISALVPTYEMFHKNIRGNLSLWERFLFEAAARGSMPVLEACLDNGADVNAVSDGKNAINLGTLDILSRN